MVGRLGRITQTYFQKKSGAPGDSLVAEVVTTGKQTVSVSMYQQAGFVSRPSKDARLAVLPLGEGTRVMVGVGCKNFAVNFVIAEGETTIFSTSSDGKTIKARIDLDNTGKIKISNSAKSLKTVLDSFSSALQTFSGATSQASITAGGTTAAVLAAALVALMTSLNASLATAKADLAQLLKD